MNKENIHKYELLTEDVMGVVSQEFMGMFNNLGVELKTLERALK